MAESYATAYCLPHHQASDQRRRTPIWPVTAAEPWTGAQRHRSPSIPQFRARPGRQAADSAHVPRDGLRPSLLLYFAASATRLLGRMMPLVLSQQENRERCSAKPLLALVRPNVRRWTEAVLRSDRLASSK